VDFAYDAAARRLLWLARPNARHSRDIAEAPESAPSAGATCSTQQGASSNQMTFKLHFG
jgi:hypothetical protein